MGASPLNGVGLLLYPRGMTENPAPVGRLLLIVAVVELVCGLLALALALLMPAAFEGFPMALLGGVLIFSSIGFAYVSRIVARSATERREALDQTSD